MRLALETTWNPRGRADELLVQDASGAPLTRRKTLQFTGSVTDDPAAKRTVVTVGGSGGAGVGKHVAGGTFLSGNGPQVVPGLGCTVTVPDDGSGFGMVLYSYIVGWHAHGNGATKSVTTTWDVRVDGTQIFPPSNTNPASVRPFLTDTSPANARYIFTAPADSTTASTGATTTVSGGLAVSVPLTTAGSGHGLMPAAPILLRVAAGSRTVDVYWTNASGGTDEVSIDMGAAMAIPIGV